MSLSSALRWAVPCLLLFAASGCVTVYQPLVSLQRPVVVDPSYPNFEGTNLLVRCIPGDDLSPGDAEVLCRKVGTLFRNQGATVNHEVPRAEGSRFADQKPDYVMDIRSRLLHQDNARGSGLLCYLTLTIIPMIEEQSFEQAVTIRDANGFLLAQDTYQGRFIEYFGIGVWGINATLDVLARSEEDRVTGDRAKSDFSKDFYGQLSQLLFNAQVRSKVLSGFQPPPVSKDGPPPSQLGAHD